MYLKKLINFYFVASVIIVAACSKQESTPAPTLENVFPSTMGIGLPSRLGEIAKSDPNASNEIDFSAAANNLIIFNTYFRYRPSTATKLATPISSNGGNTSVTYTWSEGLRIKAIQITDNGYSYLWEYFYKSSDSTTWRKFLKSEEAKDKSWDSLKIYNELDSTSGWSKDQIEWKKLGDQMNYTFCVHYPTDKSFSLSINIRTHAGTVSSYDGIGTKAVLTKKYIWGADGHGSWESFDYYTGIHNGSGTW